MKWPWRRRISPVDTDTTSPEPAAALTESTVPPAAAAGVPDGDVVVFVHLPKCGGTSLHEWLTESLEPGVLSPERNRMPAELPPERIAELHRHRVFSGHFDVIDLTHLPAPQRRFTVLRDPVDRLVSLYDFWRAHDPAFVEEHDLAGPRFALAVTFEEFVSSPDPSVVHDIDNSMVRTFTGSIRTSEPISDREAELERAIAVLAGFDHVGHVRRLDDTADWLRAVLGLPASSAGGPGRANVRGEWAAPHLRNVERTIVTPAAAAAIEPVVDLDRRLVDAFS